MVYFRDFEDWHAHFAVVLQALHFYESQDFQNLVALHIVFSVAEKAEFSDANPSVVLSLPACIKPPNPLNHVFFTNLLRNSYLKWAFSEIIPLLIRQKQRSQSILRST
jgi:hypothetical protein